MRVLITTVPFGSRDRTPLDLLEAAGIDYLINPLNRKLKESELAEMIPDFDCVIAGTEQIGSFAMQNASKLKLISRVGIGLDSVDLLDAERRGIQVCYTPEAPAPAVAELTIGLMISLLRSIQISNMEMHRGEWSRYFGRRLENCTVGIIGAGRIGSRVIRYLEGFDVKSVLINDPNREKILNDQFNTAFVDKDTIFREADIVSLHLPLTVETRNMISKPDLLTMKNDAILLNTSRGGIVNEQDLYEVLEAGHLGGAAIDVFNKEPYEGLLSSIERCVLTAHMGSMSIDCRVRMEIEATEEVVRLFNGEALMSVVTEEEYNVQRSGL